MMNKHPTIVIINGANWIGSKLVELMIEQNGNVIVVDDFTTENMPFIKRFSDNKHFVFIEKDKIESLRDNFTQIKYFVHLKNDYDTSDDKISSKYFIAETHFIDEVLTLALEKKSTYILTSSIHLHKDFLLKKNYAREDTNNAYNESDLQNYVEKTVLEYVEKAGLDGRITRLGNLYGPEMDLSTDPLLKQILSDAFYKDEIRIYGDGLEYMYYVYISDAIQGILKTLFTPETKGKIYALTNSEEVSVLTMVNKILALQLHAKRIKFLKSKSLTDPLYEKAYIPDENLSEIGWKPNVSFDRGISQVVNFFRKDISLKETTSFREEEHESNGPRQDSIFFDFDDTINLAAQVTHTTSEEEHQQFKDFHRKLNNPDSPIYNKNRARRDPFTIEKRGVKFYLKLASYFIFFSVLYIFLIVPVFRFGMYFKDIKTTTDTIVENLDNNYQTPVEKHNLTNEARNNFAGINWAVKLFDQKSLENNMIKISNGLDDAEMALELIQKNNLAPYINTTRAIPEADVNKVQNVLFLLNSTRNHLEGAENVNYPFQATDTIVKIRNWAYETEKNLSNKIKSN